MLAIDGREDISASNVDTLSSDHNEGMTGEEWLMVFITMIGAFCVYILLSMLIRGMGSGDLTPFMVY